MTKEKFTKHWGNPNEGYTWEEALAKKAKVDDGYDTYSPRSKWEKAQIVPDPTKKSGYMVIISTK